LYFLDRHAKKAVVVSLVLLLIGLNLMSEETSAKAKVLSEKEVKVFSGDYSKKVELVFNYLNEKSAWTQASIYKKGEVDPALGEEFEFGGSVEVNVNYQKEFTTLMTCLDFATKLKSPEFIVPLIDHIEYQDTALDSKAYKGEPSLTSNALEAIGLPAVDEIITAIKECSKKEDGRRYQLALCLHGIYQVGGHGLDMAVFRLRKEQKMAKDKDVKANLSEAIKIIKKAFTKKVKK